MKVHSLILDYDGTISPLNIPREESVVPAELQRVLVQIGKHIPIAVLSTKDISFISQRTSFAHAWAGIGGLEIKIGERTIRAESLTSVLHHITKALAYAKKQCTAHMVIEEKKDIAGRSLAFCIDWRTVDNDENVIKAVADIRAYCQRLPLETITYDGQPFFDVYPCRIDKGSALEQLKKELNLTTGIMYLGDSKVDNPAFRIADIAIGVRHTESAPDLECDYYLNFSNVTRFFQSLLSNHLMFDSFFPELLQRR